MPEFDEDRSGRLFSSNFLLISSKQAEHDFRQFDKKSSKSRISLNSNIFTLKQTAHDFWEFDGNVLK